VEWMVLDEIDVDCLAPDHGMRPHCNVDQIVPGRDHLPIMDGDVLTAMRRQQPPRSQ